MVLCAGARQHLGTYFAHRILREPLLIDTRVQGSDYCLVLVRARSSTYSSCSNTSKGSCTRGLDVQLCDNCFGQVGALRQVKNTEDNCLGEQTYKVSPISFPYAPCYDRNDIDQNLPRSDTLSGLGLVTLGLQSEQLKNFYRSQESRK